MIRHAEIWKYLRQFRIIPRPVHCFSFNETLTPMGTRRLRWWMNYPLVEVESIKARLAAVAELKDDHILRLKLRKILSCIYDMERLAGRISLRAANPRDLVALKVSLLAIPELKSMLNDCTSPAVAAIRLRFTEMSAVIDLIPERLLMIHHQKLRMAVLLLPVMIRNLIS